jgi:hypothetical protein
VSMSCRLALQPSAKAKDATASQRRVRRGIETYTCSVAAS